MDLNKEKESIKSYIKSRIENHPKEEKIGYIQAGYQFDQAGWLCIYFDTEENAEPDGSWTMHIEGNSKEYNHWVTECETQDYEEFGENIGNLIKQSFFELRDEGIFNALNKYKDCEFGIEEINGTYGWPNYEERKNENLV